jgi:hypothetical protein
MSCSLFNASALIKCPVQVNYARGLINTKQLAIGDFSGFDAAKMAKIKFTEHYTECDSRIGFGKAGA